MSHFNFLINVVIFFCSKNVEQIQVLFIKLFQMVSQLYLIFALATLAYAVPAPVADENGKTLIDSKQINEINDLKTASSSCK